MRSAKITGTGAYVPSRVVTNEELEARVPGVNARWTVEHLGIRERRIAEGDESTGTMASAAGADALGRAGLQPQDLELLIVCTTTPQHVAPSTACFVQRRLGAVGCAAFDVGAVCAGFIYGLAIARQFIAAGTYRNALVIGADTFSRITDWTRRDCVFFGDGAGAIVLEACPEGEGILTVNIEADGTDYEDWTVLAGGAAYPASHATVDKGMHFWQMDGAAIYRHATTLMPQSLAKSLARSGLVAQDVNHVFPHQPNINIVKKVAEVSGIPFERFHTNMDRYANTSAAAVPIVLHEAIVAGELKPGEIVAIVTIGVGWAWGSAVMRWM